MMKLKPVITAVLLTMACFFINQRGVAQQKTIKPLDANVAVKFINSYINYLNRAEQEELYEDSTLDWILNHKLLTPSYKEAYRKLEATNEFFVADPILSAQDFPDKGYELLDFDEKTGVATLRGKGIVWKDFITKVKLVNIDGKTLVDGSGYVNTNLND